MSSTEQKLFEQDLPEFLRRFEEEGKLSFDGPNAEKAEQMLNLLRQHGLVEQKDFAIGKDYRILRQIGRGGMGVVYLAEKLPHHRKVAIKTIRPELLRKPGARERFKREAEAVAKLRHEGIVSLIDFRDEEPPFYVMEWVEGCTLDEVLENFQSMNPQYLTGADMQRAVALRVHGSESPSAADSLAPTFRGIWEDACLRIVWQVADALDYSHSLGVTHRDIKPSNILLTPSGKAMLFDFGLAGVQEETKLTRTGYQVGTLLYTPPESLEAEPKTFQNAGDIYSLGITLYELLTLRSPYLAPSPGKTLQLILEGRTLAPKLLNPSLTEGAQVVCLRAMDKNPDLRHPTAKVLSDEIALALEGRTPKRKKDRTKAAVEMVRPHFHWIWILSVIMAFMLGLLA